MVTEDCGGNASESNCNKVSKNHQTVQGWQIYGLDDNVQET